MKQSRKKIIPIFLLFLFFSSTPYAESSDVPVRAINHIAMYTDFKAILYGDSSNTDPEALLSAGRTAFDAVDALENRISNWKADSYTALVNKKASTEPTEVSGDLIEILEDARRVYLDTDGAFDVTVGPLIQFWKTHEKKGMLPSAEELKPVLAQIGLKYVLVDKMADTIYFEKPGLNLDFGGIAKGLALDRMAVVLEENEVKTALLNAGSSTILAMGHPPGEAGWTISIDSPYNKDSGKAVASVVICNESLSTSSNAERYFDIDGKRYSHIFNPHTGMPVHGLASATAIAPTGTESDALSTAFFVMGVAGVRAYCDTHPKVRAVLVEDQCETDKVIFINFPDDKQKE